MYNIVGFWNSYGSGDLAESRKFVQNIMQLIPAKEYVYYCGKSSRILMDIPNLKIVSTGVPNVLPDTVPFVYDDINLNFFMNTWIGRNSSYVKKGIGCTIEELHRMYTDILRQASPALRLSKPPKPLWQLSSKDPLDYLFQFDYSKYEIKGIQEYLAGTEVIKKVFVSNGAVHSQQADNFDMTPLIRNLAKKFPFVLFFVSEEFMQMPKNVVNANSLTPTGLDCNLPELAYLSENCDLLIGRNSGAHVFSWTRKNIMERGIPNITFSFHPDGQHFVFGGGINMRKHWSGETDTKVLTRFVSKIIEEEVL